MAADDFGGVVCDISPLPLTSGEGVSTELDCKPPRENVKVSDDFRGSSAFPKLDPPCCGWPRDNEPNENAVPLVALLADAISMDLLPTTGLAVGLAVLSLSPMPATILFKCMIGVVSNGLSTLLLELEGIIPAFVVVGVVVKLNVNSELETELPVEEMASPRENSGVSGGVISS